MSEGEFKKRIQQLMKPWDDEPVELEALANSLLFKIVDEARKDFLKDFTDDDLLVLKEYGLEDDAKLHPDAIKLKSEILARWAKQSVPAFLKWFGSP